MRILLSVPVIQPGASHKRALWDDQAEATGHPLPPGSGQWFWVKALRSLGHSVFVFQHGLPLRSGGRRWLRLFQTFFPWASPRIRLRNSRLRRLAGQLEPQVLLVSGGMDMNLLPPTLIAIRRRGIPIILLNGTSPVLFSNPLERRAAPYFDLVVTNDLYHAIQWKELGAREALSLPVSACDPEYHRHRDLDPDEEGALAAQVAFVGALSPASLYAERLALLERLAPYGLGIWSDDQSAVLSNPRLAPHYQGRAWGEKMVKVLSACQMAFNHHGHTMQYGGNMRLFEIAGCGACQLVEDKPAIGQWFTPGQEVACYRDGEDLERLVQYYLQHPQERLAMARRGQERAYAQHTYRHRMARLVELAQELRPGRGGVP